jgi:hypothetical protein
MLFPIIILLMVLSPLAIPTAVTVVHEFGNWGRRRLAPACAWALPALG